MKKTKLKFAAAVAALAMTFALFTGCNPGEDATSSDTTGSTDSTTSTTGSTDSATSTDNESDSPVSTETGGAVVANDGSITFITRTISKLPTFKSASIELTENSTGGNYQGAGKLFADDNEYIPTAGDVITLTFNISASEERSFTGWKGLCLALVDRGADGTAWDKLAISDGNISGKEAGSITTTAADYTATFTLSKTASAAENVDFVFYYGTSSSSAVTLTVNSVSASGDGGIVITESNDVGYFSFSAFNGYSDTFSIKDYSKVTLKLLLTKDGAAVTSTANTGKFTINNSTLGWGSNIFNGGYGDGLVVKYLNNLTPDENGYATMSISLTGISDIATADCFASQNGSNDGKITLAVKEAKFEK